MMRTTWEAGGTLKGWNMGIPEKRGLGFRVKGLGLRA